MKISRRQLMLGLSSSLGMISLPNYIWAEEKYSKREIEEFSLLPESRWSKEQKDGRNEVERKFRRRAIPRKNRNKLFEGLVWAVKQGKRDSKEICDTAKIYLETKYAEIPDWVKLLAYILSIISSILWILLLFI